MTLEEVRALRAKWEKDAGVAAKDVLKLCDFIIERDLVKNIAERPVDDDTSAEEVANILACREIVGR